MKFGLNCWRNYVRGMSGKEWQEGLDLYFISLFGVWIWFCVCYGSCFSLFLSYFASYGSSHGGAFQIYGFWVNVRWLKDVSLFSAALSGVMVVE